SASSSPHQQIYDPAGKRPVDEAELSEPNDPSTRFSGRAHLRHAAAPPPRPARRRGLRLPAVGPRPKRVADGAGGAAVAAGDPRTATARSSPTGTPKSCNRRT